MPYGHAGPLQSQQLKIVPAKTERAKKMWIGKALVPLVYLENGVVLIPDARYEDGKRLLEQHQTSMR